ncbi:DUF2274 domain-containing protein, partial [Klebsiella pneumoniae]
SKKPQYSTHTDDQTGISGEGDRQSRSSARTLQGVMLVTKISAIEDDKPVTLSIKLPTGIHRDLIAYAKSSRATVANP